MQDYFKSLVREKTPEFIMSLKDISHGQLHYIQCKFFANGRYCIASSFYTDSWIAPTMAGFSSSVNQKVMMNQSISLEDVAIVKWVDDNLECKNYPALTVRDIEKGIQELQSIFEKQTLSLFSGNIYGDTVSAKFYVTPCPLMILTFMNGKNLLGTLGVNTNGDVSMIFCCNQRLHIYYKEMQTYKGLRGLLTL